MTVTNSFVERLATARVLVVGDIMLDRYWFGEVDRISPEAPVPVVRVTGEDLRLGGAANVARNAAALGAKVGLMGLVGNDEAGAQVRTLVANSAIDDHLLTEEGARTTVKLRVNGRAQQLLRMDFEAEHDSAALERKNAAFVDALAGYDAIILSDYGKGALGRIAALIRHARTAGKPVLVDPKGSDYSIYRGATLVTPNRQELAQVIGDWCDEDDLTKRSQALRLDLELEALLLTRSEKGMTLFDGAGRLNQPVEAREVYDVTGAGDTVIATCGTLVAAGVPLREVIPLANRAGGIVVGKYGTAVVTAEELFS